MLLATTLVVGAGASSAQATTCPNLQTALTGASDGATIDIDSTIIGCSVTLPSGKHVTLRGTTASAGFDGNASGAANITGTDVGATVIRDLTFRNSTRTAVSSSGAAISIGGSSAPVLDNDRFFNNKVTGGPTSNGGAVQIAAIAGTGAIEITNSTFGSTAAGQGNSALGSGGGLILNAGAHSARVVNNVFAGNSARRRGRAVPLLLRYECRRHRGAGQPLRAEHVGQQRRRRQHLRLGDDRGQRLHRQPTDG